MARIGDIFSIPLWNSESIGLHESVRGVEVGDVAVGKGAISTLLYPPGMGDRVTVDWRMRTNQSYKASLEEDGQGKQSNNDIQSFQALKMKNALEMNNSIELDHSSLDSLDIVQICLGSRHGVLLTRDGSVLTFGSNDCYQLGVTDIQQSTKPVLVSGLQDVVVVQIATGEAHTVALTDKGHLYAWGRNHEGQCGTSMRCADTPNISSTNNGNRPHPRFIAGLDGHECVSVKCGSRFTVALTTHGTVWTWGEGLCGELGTGRCTLSDKPKQVQFPDQASSTQTPQSKQTQTVHIKQIAAGWAHVLALTKDGTMYAWGMNSKGQLGVGDLKTRWTPTFVLTNESIEISQIACGGMFSCAVNKHRSQLYYWGIIPKSLRNSNQVDIVHESNTEKIEGTESPPSVHHIPDQIASMSPGYDHQTNNESDGKDNESNSVFSHLEQSFSSYGPDMSFTPRDIDTEESTRQMETTTETAETMKSTLERENMDDLNEIRSNQFESIDASDSMDSFSMIEQRAKKAAAMAEKASQSAYQYIQSATEKYGPTSTLKGTMQTTTNVGIQDDKAQNVLDTFAAKQNIHQRHSLHDNRYHYSSAALRPKHLIAAPKNQPMNAQKRFRQENQTFAKLACGRRRFEHNQVQEQTKDELLSKPISNVIAIVPTEWKIPILENRRLSHITAGYDAFTIFSTPKLNSVFPRTSNLRGGSILRLNGMGFSSLAQSIRTFASKQSAVDVTEGALNAIVIPYPQQSNQLGSNNFEQENQTISMEEFSMLFDTSMDRTCLDIEKTQNSSDYKETHNDASEDKRTQNKSPQHLIRIPNLIAKFTYFGTLTSTLIQDIDAENKTQSEHMNHTEQDNVRTVQTAVYVQASHLIQNSMSQLHKSDIASHLDCSLYVFTPRVPQASEYRIQLLSVKANALNTGLASTMINREPAINRGGRYSQPMYGFLLKSIDEPDGNLVGIPVANISDCALATLVQPVYEYICDTVTGSVLHSYHSDLVWNQVSPDSCTIMTQHDEKMPQTQSQEPVITPNEPVITPNEPATTSNEPATTPNEPVIANKTHEATEILPLKELDATLLTSPHENTGSCKKQDEIVSIKGSGIFTAMLSDPVARHEAVSLLSQVERLRREREEQELQALAEHDQDVKMTPRVSATQEYEDLESNVEEFQDEDLLLDGPIQLGTESVNVQKLSCTMIRQLQSRAAPLQETMNTSVVSNRPAASILENKETDKDALENASMLENQATDKDTLENASMLENKADIQDTTKNLLMIERTKHLPRVKFIITANDTIVDQTQSIPATYFGRYFETERNSDKISVSDLNNQDRLESKQEIEDDIIEDEDEYVGHFEGEIRVKIPTISLADDILGQPPTRRPSSLFQMKTDIHPTHLAEESTGAADATDQIATSTDRPSSASNRSLSRSSVHNKSHQTKRDVKQEQEINSASNHQSIDCRAKWYDSILEKNDWFKSEINTIQRQEAAITKSVCVQLWPSISTNQCQYLSCSTPIHAISASVSHVEPQFGLITGGYTLYIRGVGFPTNPSTKIHQNTAVSSAREQSNVIVRFLVQSNPDKYIDTYHAQIKNGHTIQLTMSEQLAQELKELGHTNLNEDATSNTSIHDTKHESEIHSDHIDEMYDETNSTNMKEIDNDKMKAESVSNDTSKDISVQQSSMTNSKDIPAQQSSMTDSKEKETMRSIPPTQSDSTDIDVEQTSMKFSVQVSFDHGISFLSCSTSDIPDFELYSCQFGQPLNVFVSPKGGYYLLPLMDGSIPQIHTSTAETISYKEAIFGKKEEQLWDLFHSQIRVAFRSAQNSIHIQQWPFVQVVSIPEYPICIASKTANRMESNTNSCMYQRCYALRIAIPSIDDIQWFTQNQTHNLEQTIGISEQQQTEEQQQRDEQLQQQTEKQKTDGQSPSPPDQTHSDHQIHAQQKDKKDTFEMEHITPNDLWMNIHVSLEGDTVHTKPSTMKGFSCIFGTFQDTLKITNITPKKLIVGNSSDLIITGWNSPDMQTLLQPFPTSLSIDIIELLQKTGRIEIDPSTLLLEILPLYAFIGQENPQALSSEGLYSNLSVLEITEQSLQTIKSLHDTDNKLDSSTTKRSSSKSNTKRSSSPASHRGNNSLNQINFRMKIPENPNLIGGETNLYLTFDGLRWTAPFPIKVTSASTSKKK